MIFKAEEGKDAERKLKQIDCVKKFIFWQENVWESENIMLKWVDEALRKYFIFNLKRKHY